MTIRLVPDIEFNSSTGEIRRENTTVRLEPQPAAVLAALAARHGELVTHDELRVAVWGDTNVKLHDALHYCVRQIRSALGDTAREPRYVETIPRRGYRMRADALAPALPAAPASPIRRVFPHPWVVRAAVAAIVMTTAVVIDRRPNNHHEIAVKVVKTLHNLVF